MLNTISTQPPPAAFSYHANDQVSHVHPVGAATGLGPKDIPEAWTRVDKEIAKRVHTRNQDHDFWWKTTGLTLAILLDKAQYPSNVQYRYLYMYYSAIVPELGAGPQSDGSAGRWKSFMTDHFCPVEFSWEWNRKDETPLVRFSFETISTSAGTAEDPYNEFATMRFVHERSPWIMGCDLAWFQSLWDSLICFSGTGANGSCKVDAGLTHESRSFLALDLNDTSMTLKAYYLPAFKARSQGISQIDLICDAVERLPDQTDNFAAAYKQFKAFLANTPTGQQLQPEIVATDCVPAHLSRVKVYMRSKSTSFKSVVSTLMMASSEGEEAGKDAVEEFRKLWYLTLGLSEEVKLEDELPTTEHRTAGILYYFEMSPKSPVPAVKVYLPVRHYGESDVSTATRLQQYMRSTSRADHTDKYLSALNNIVATSICPQQQGFQTYLCAMLGKSMRLTSYLSPVVYRSVDGEKVALPMN